MGRRGRCERQTPRRSVPTASSTCSLCRSGSPLPEIKAPPRSHPDCRLLLAPRMSHQVKRRAQATGSDLTVPQTETHRARSLARSPLLLDGGAVFPFVAFLEQRVHRGGGGGDEGATDPPSALEAAAAAAKGQQQQPRIKAGRPSPQAEEEKGQQSAEARRDSAWGCFGRACGAESGKKGEERNFTAPSRPAAAAAGASSQPGLASLVGAASRGGGAGGGARGSTCLPPSRTRSCHGGRRSHSSALPGASEPGFGLVPLGCFVLGAGKWEPKACHAEEQQQQRRSFLLVPPSPPPRLWP